MNVFFGALDQTWEPFVLILGLIFIGHAAALDGLFEAVGARLANLPGDGVTLFVSMMMLVAIVTATLNLDTSVVFLTPILLNAARQRGVDERAFLYGSIFMANAASLLLLGSNLTNILVFTGRSVRGATFTDTMVAAWLTSVLITTLVVAVWNWRGLRTVHSRKRESAPPIRRGIGLIAFCAATILMLVLRSPALPVFIVGVVAEGVEILALRRVSVAASAKVANLPLLSTLFALALGVASLARVWHYPAHVMSTAGTWATGMIGAGSANVINNLPAAALLSSRLPAHPYQLLLGLDLGPNLCVVGAMSSLLWLRIARQHDAAPSAWTFSRIGVIVTALTLLVALAIT
jgi:arsenical pump membrane protein